jgi:hypothetical protein
MTRNYPRLPIETFGRQLIESGDLDPLYIALNSCSGLLGPQRLKRWLLAYWAFYHAGVASYLADSSDPEQYWWRWKTAAENHEETPVGGRWPRGHERRHMRGAAASQCWEDLRARYPDAPEDFTDGVRAETCGDVMKRVSRHVQFGPWIGFKVADMLERVLGWPVNFQTSTVFFFRDPRKAAVLYAGTARPTWLPTDSQAVEWASESLLREFNDLQAPPARDRPVGLQEVETVLCKWKSHLNGHYPVGFDTAEIKTGLRQWASCSPTAWLVSENMP